MTHAVSALFYSNTMVELWRSYAHQVKVPGVNSRKRWKCFRCPSPGICYNISQNYCMDTLWTWFATTSRIRRNGVAEEFTHGTERNQKDVMRQKLLKALLTLLVVSVLTGCIATAKKEQPPRPSPQPSPEAYTAEVHWGYEGEIGPEHWGELSEAYKLCAVGKQQSPVNIARATKNDKLPGLEFAYEPVSPATVVNNGHTIQINVPEGSTLTFDGKTYHLLQYHFHNPSEHAIRGKLSDMELHLVHKDNEGNLLVVGVLLKVGRKDNPVLASFWDAMPAEKGENTVDTPINIADLLPSNRAYYTYMGSLTTPPCTEGVRWIVLTSPVEISKAQSDAYARILGGTNRPLQPLNERTIEVSSFDVGI